jgi:hypothetical protein
MDSVAIGAQLLGSATTVSSAASWPAASGGCGMRCGCPSLRCVLPTNRRRPAVGVIAAGGGRLQAGLLRAAAAGDLIGLRLGEWQILLSASHSSSAVCSSTFRTAG